MCGARGSHERKENAFTERLREEDAVEDRGSSRRIKPK
jgi:hypothetical protein